MNHPVLIGAGGVASYLLPVLLKTFKPAKLTLIDKDVLEERNLDRQMFDESSVGHNKAEALVACNRGGQRNWPAVEIITEWFTDATVLPDDVDALICMADNHEARHATILKARELGIRAYIGGNEYLDSQAFIYSKEMDGTPKDPLVRYPDIATSHEGSPFRCQGDAQISSPQLAIANLSCAAKLLHLLWVYERWLPPVKHELTAQSLGNLPVELFTSLTENSSL
jgi:molybdopterin/thiamine biosynthesis adenylyltransferase